MAVWTFMIAVTRPGANPNPKRGLYLTSFQMFWPRIPVVMYMPDTERERGKRKGGGRVKRTVIVSSQARMNDSVRCSD